MSQPCIISVAITGSLPRKSDNPAVPITIAEQVESTQQAFEAGATLAHVHVRNDDQTPSSDPEKFGRLLEGLHQHCPGLIVQFSTGGRSGADKERGGMLPLKPDMASLATGWGWVRIERPGLARQAAAWRALSTGAPVLA